MQHTVVFTRAAKKDLRRIDKSAQLRILDAIEAMAADPRVLSDGRVTGRPGVWKLRVGGYRVLFTLVDDELIVEVIRIRKRGEVYKKRTR